MIVRVFSPHTHLASRWHLLFKMPRKPRLPAMVAYLLLLTVGLVLYVSSRGLENEGIGVFTGTLENAQETPKGPGSGGWDGGRGVAGRKQKTRGRLKQLPINPHNYHMMINNPKICGSDKMVSILIVVSSSVDNFYRRRAIRETWGGSGPLGVSHAKLVFLLGNPLNSELQTKVVEESRTYGDVLQEDYVDSYMNLTIKSVMGLKWASVYCQQAKYFMKTDDDMYVNVPSLLTYLQEADRSRWITGCIKQKKSFRPVNASPGMPLPPAHPPFVAGAGYVISGDIVEELYKASLQTRMIPVEDVYVTAHLAKRVGVHPPVHDGRFSCGEMVMDDCDLTQVFTGHRISPDRMFQIWEKLNPNGITSPCFDF
ncbi:beta-1,3-galactosyltransferase 1-like isoform X2 [Macrobrachium nipponense]|uniref:beta-1,3-galactosyltransferase 1-like isoform X2 n=1 Tax=Macrobrachium nipponense TaxID=159736 RepID=UPI0030C87336